MQKLTGIFCVVIFLAAVVSCGKKAAEVNPDFVGTWKWEHGTNLDIIIIEEDSKGTYKSCFNCAGSFCDCHEPGTGRARVKDGKLSIGISKWNISQMPTKTGVYRWEMGLDGHTYVK